MTELNKATLEYTKTRKQFGVPLSSFQALELQQPVDAGVFEHTLGISQRHDLLRHRPGMQLSVVVRLAQLRNARREFDK